MIAAVKQDKRPAYVRQLELAAEASQQRAEELAEAVHYLRRYLALPKFHNEQWVSVSDVLARLPVVYPSDLGAK